MGPVLPLSDSGIPESEKFIASSAAKIEQHFLSEKTASLAYTIMAQPLEKDSKTFCLCIFGTDNKFNYNQVREI